MRFLYLSACFILLGSSPACTQAATSVEPTLSTTVSIAAADEIEKESTEEVEKEVMEKHFLALGDSYTIGESVPEEERWPVQLASYLNEEGIPFAAPEIIARTGWTTDELAAAIEESDTNPPYDLVGLLIGVNNQYRGYAQDAYREEFASLLQTAIDFAGGDAHHVIVLNIPDWGATPFAARDPRGPETISNQISAFNQINQEETERLGAHYVDIFPISQLAYEDASLIADDSLHPSGSQYTLWAQAALPITLGIFR